MSILVPIAVLGGALLMVLGAYLNTAEGLAIAIVAFVVISGIASAAFTLVGHPIVKAKHS